MRCVLAFLLLLLASPLLAQQDPAPQAASDKLGSAARAAEPEPQYAQLPQAMAEPPACTEAREGMTACFVERACVCRYQHGGQLTGRPSGYRWDCGINRPGCGVAAAGPPPSAVPQGAYPAPHRGSTPRPYPQ